MEKQKSDNYFCALAAVDLGEHIEEKNGLSYLSWAWAWRYLKERYPDSTYTVYEDPEGRCYHTDGRTAWVKVSVTVQGIEHIEYLPVMDNRNASIPLSGVTSTNVNKAIQRAITKAIARHGLGLYIYAGEDLPAEIERSATAPPQKITREELATLNNVIGGNKAIEKWLREYYGLSDLADMNEAQFVTALRQVQEYHKRQQALLQDNTTS